MIQTNDIISTQKAINFLFLFLFLKNGYKIRQEVHSSATAGARQ